MKIKNIIELCLFFAIIFLSGCATKINEIQYNEAKYNSEDVEKNYNELICNSDSENVTCTDKQFKLYNGIAYSNYDNGNILRKINFINGMPNGKSLIFYKDGTLLGEFNYKEGKLDGISRVYYKDGKVFMEVLYNQSHFQFGRMYSQNGKLLSLRTENNEKWYYESGQLKYEHALKNDKPFGVIKVYYETGELKALVNLNENETTKIYHKNGYLKMDIGKSRDLCFDNLGNKIYCTVENVKSDLDDILNTIIKNQRESMFQRMTDNL